MESKTAVWRRWWNLLPNSQWAVGLGLP